MEWSIWMALIVSCLLPTEPATIPLNTIQPSVLSACDLIVDAGPDIELCFPGGEVMLMGSVTGNAVHVAWTPADDLSDPFILNPIADVTAPITYTLTVFGYDPDNPNLVVNGDFESGNTGFTSDYTYLEDLPGFQEMDEGEYGVLENPNNVHGGWSPCVDHTTGDGNLMVLNAAPDYQNVWCQDIDVMPNTWYNVEAWVASVHPVSPANLQFSINGMEIGPIITAPGVVCQWIPFNSLWFSGSASTATLCILNQNTTAFGNDFAIDDISMTELCMVEDEVNITLIGPPAEPVINGDGPLCPGESATFTTPDNPGVEYDWDTSNELDIVSGQGTNEIDVLWAEEGEGEICLTITSECGSSETCITITLLPEIETLFDTILCQGETFTVNGTVYGNGNWFGIESYISVEGCDSLVYIEVEEAPVSQFMITEFLCTGDSVFLEGAYQTESGIYTDQFISSLGCDSIVVTELIVSDVDSTFLTSYTCDIAQAGITITTYNIGNCDSVVISEVVLLPSDTLLISETSCNPADTGTVIQIFVSQASCDSVVITHTTLVSADTTVISSNTCDLQQVGTTVDTLQNLYGCDSLVINDIIYSESDTSWFFASSCFLSDTGTVTNLLVNSEGCDSLVILHTSYAGSDTVFIMGSSCNPAEAGQFITAHLNQNGCDSIVSTFIALLPVDTTRINQLTCDAAQAGVIIQPYVNQYGCDSIVITTTILDQLANCQFDASLDIQQPLCYGDTAWMQLELVNGLAPFIIFWQNGPLQGSDTFPASGSYLLPVIHSGSVEIELLSANGLFITDTFMVNELLPLEADAVVKSDYSGYGVPCYNDSLGEVQINLVSGGTSPVSFMWSNGAASQQLTDLPQGNYEVTITDDNGCMITDQVMITQPPPMLYELVIDDILCYGETGSIEVEGISGGVEPWSMLLDGSVFIPGLLPQDIAGGLHELVIMDANACIAEENFMLNDPTAWDIALGPDTILPYGTIFNLDALLTGQPNGELMIEWLDEKCDNCLARQVEATATKSYIIRGVDENGCVQGDTIVIRVSDDASYYIPNVFTPNGDQVNDRFFIFTNPAVEEIEELSIFDRWGDNVFQRLHFAPNDPGLGWDGMLKDKELNPGVFAYKAWIRFRDGRREVRYGDVTLIR